MKSEREWEARLHGSYRALIMHWLLVWEKWESGVGEALEDFEGKSDMIK